MIGVVNVLGFVKVWLIVVMIVYIVVVCSLNIVMCVLGGIMGFLGGFVGLIMLVVWGIYEFVLNVDDVIDFVNKFKDVSKDLSFYVNLIGK